MVTFQVLAGLLDYPSERLAGELREMREILEREALVGAEELSALDPLFRELAERDLYELQERYVELFDQSRSLSLYLFEHVYGESRDRGQSMVDLLARYAAIGLELDARELPDFLPAFLEYLSQLPLDRARRELGEAVAVLRVLADRLARRASPYAEVIRAIEHIAEAEPTPADLEELALEELPGGGASGSADDEWEEAPVDFSRDEAAFAGRQRARSLGAARRKKET